MAANTRLEETRQKQAIEENLDTHFDRKRIDIQAEILRKKEKKEKASQQNIRPATTTAYEPIQLTKMGQRDSDEEANQRRDKAASDQESGSESSSSESDEEDSELQEKQKRRFINRVTPSRRDELNHAKCVKDLSFYKLNWSDADLETFHRPNI